MRKGFVTCFLVAMISLGIIFAAMVLTLLNSYHMLEFKSQITEKISDPAIPELVFNSFLEMKVDDYHTSVRNLISEYLITKDDNLRTVIGNKFKDMFEKYKAVLIIGDQTFNPNNINLDEEHNTAFRKIATINGYEKIQLRFYK